jgi:hypothetical protein
MRTKLSLVAATFALFSLLGFMIGCSKAPTDAQMSSDIQNKLNTDSGLQGKQLGVQADKGTITLTGVVDNQAQRDAASRYASSEAGVKQVVNNIQVQEAANQPSSDQMMMQAAPPPPAPIKEKSKPSPSTHKAPKSNDANSMMAANPQPQAQQNAPAPDQSMPAPAPVPEAAAPPPPPPPQKATVPSGTAISIRLVDEITTTTAQQGQTFRATLNSPLSVDGEVVVPAGYDVEGHIVAAQSSGKFAGQSLLTLQLDRIIVGEKHYAIQTDQYHKETSSRGKNTAEKVGGGAAVGAILGGIFGGGKGAAIGAAAGGGAGGGVQAASKSQQITLASETMLNFTLQAPVTVTVTTKGPDSNRPQLGSSNSQ